MQRIKYIIIFILTLGLVFLYVQLTDYNEISNSLLKQNSSSNEKIDNLESQVSTLKAENQVFKDIIATQKQKIFLLEEELEVVKVFYDQNHSTIPLPVELNTTEESNTTIKLPNRDDTQEKSIFDRIFNQ